MFELSEFVCYQLSIFHLIHDEETQSEGVFNGLRIFQCVGCDVIHPLNILNPTAPA
jgi:hypothetical protein